MEVFIIKKLLKSTKFTKIIIILIILIIVWNIVPWIFRVKVYETPKKYTQPIGKKDINVSSKYSDFLNISQNYTTIPGLKEGAIPQGMCYSQKYKMLIISSYHQGGAPSILHFIDYETGKLIKTLILKNDNNSFYKGHAGGLATDNNKLWLVDNYTIYEYSLSELLELKDMEYAIPHQKNGTITKADFSAYSEGILWVGEYHYPFIYPTKESHYIQLPNGEKNHALLLGYKLDDKGDIDYQNPNFAISVPSKIQGLTFSKEGNFVISQSFWSFESSEIRTYQNILEIKTADTFRINEKEIPLWILSEDKLIKKITLPPMVEAIQEIEGKVFTLFESSSNLYKYYTHDRINSIIKSKL